MEGNACLAYGVDGKAGVDEIQDANEDDHDNVCYDSLRRRDADEEGGCGKGGERRMGRDRRRGLMEVGRNEVGRAKSVKKRADERGKQRTCHRFTSALQRHPEDARLVHRDSLLWTGRELSRRFSVELGLGRGKRTSRVASMLPRKLSVSEEGESQYNFPRDTRLSRLESLSTLLRSFLRLRAPPSLPLYRNALHRATQRRRRGDPVHPARLVKRKLEEVVVEGEGVERTRDQARLRC